MKLVISVCSLATTVAEMQFECINVFHILGISVEIYNELLLGQFSILCFSARACICPDVYGILSCSTNFKHFGDKNSLRLSLSTLQSTKLITKCSPQNLKNGSLPHLGTQHDRKLADIYMANHILHMAIDELIFRKKYSCHLIKTQHTGMKFDELAQSQLFDVLFPINLRRILIFPAS